MRSSREKLRDAGRLEASLGQTEGGSETSTTGANNNSVILVINNGVVTDEARALYSINELAKLSYKNGDMHMNPMALNSAQVHDTSLLRIKANLTYS